MFRKNTTSDQEQPERIERVTSVLGSGIIWKGKLTGKGGVRIEGTFEGEIAIQGLVVVGETGKVTCENVRANTVIIAGGMRECTREYRDHCRGDEWRHHRREIRDQKNWACVGKCHRFCIFNRRRGVPSWSNNHAG